MRHLEDTGRSAGTALSYRLELATALDVLGAQTKLAQLTPACVLDYFVGDRVMRTRNGTPQAQPSWRKSRRVLLLALVWAQEAGLIETAPVPEEGAVY